MHKCSVLGRTCCQSPIHPTTFRRDIIDLLYQGERAARAPSTLRPLYIYFLSLGERPARTLSALRPSDTIST